MRDPQYEQKGNKIQQKKYNTLNMVRLNGIKHYYSFEFLDFIMDGPM